MCPLETKQKKMTFSHCRKHLAETRKGHLEKANSTLERMMYCMQRVFFSLCRQKMYKHIRNAANKSVEGIAEDDKSSRPETQWSTEELRTGAGSGFTAKILNNGGGCLGAGEARSLPTALFASSALSCTGHLQETAVTWCVCVRRPQQRHPRVLCCCCSLEWNPALMGTRAGAV